MSKLYFRYGAMNSSKTANALMVKFNYEERGQNVLLLKPSIDTRDGKSIIKSRAGLEEECDLITSTTNIFMYIKSILENKKVNCVIIDEAQFLSKHHVDEAVKIVNELNIPVICYGLRTDFQGNLFEGSQWLLAWADSIEEIKTICWCGKKATMNARISNGKIVRQGEQVHLGGNESYTSLCRLHWEQGKLSENNI